MVMCLEICSLINITVPHRHGRKLKHRSDLLHVTGPFLAEVRIEHMSLDAGWVVVPVCPTCELRVQDRLLGKFVEKEALI